MSIFDDARRGILDETKLESYVRNDPNILDKQDFASGLTPLALAVVGGFVKEVELLLKKDAKADGLCREGETPLLLATWKTTNERPLIVQLLLAQPRTRTIVDVTCHAAENKTPLMHSIANKDIDSIKMLRDAGASMTIRSQDGHTAEMMAKKGSAVYGALHPGNAQFMPDVALSFLVYTLAWVNSTQNRVVQKATGMNPELSQEIDKQVNPTGQPTVAEFLKNVNNYVKERKALCLFFKDNKNFIQDIARKATALAEYPDTTTYLEDGDSLSKNVNIPLYQHVIYCDDSTSMKRQDRWETQKKIVNRICKIATRVLPEGEGVTLRFINRKVEKNCCNMSLEEVERTLEPMSWQPGGNTEIGTYLRSKILEPLVYHKIDTRTFKRPLLIYIITDGMPEPEGKSKLVNTILECGKKLQNAQYPLESVKFVIGQIGTGEGATLFLNSLRKNKAIAPVTVVVSDRLDEQFSKFHANDGKLDRWLIETLFTPFMDI